MRRFVAIASLIAAALILGEASAQQKPSQPNYGCIAAHNCGHKANTPTAGPRDYWQNWVCTGCHLGTPSGFVPSPDERALVALPSRFWVVHAEAERDGETRMKPPARAGFLPPARIAPEFQRLLAERPPLRR